MLTSVLLFAFLSALCAGVIYAFVMRGDNPREDEEDNE